MPLYLSPVCNDQMFDVNGNPLNGGQIETYVAGSSTPAATYTSSVGSVQQANPILLNSLGKVQSPIWLTAGVSYKFIVKDSDGVTLWTIDNVSGINDASVAVSEWVSSGFVPNYISATSFSVPGDQRSILQVGRRIRTQNTAGLIYSGIVTSTFAAGVTTVTLLNDSGTLDSGLSSVWYGLISATNTSFPFATFAAANTVAVSNDDTTNATHYPLFADGTAGQENVKTGTAKLTYNPNTGRLNATQFNGAFIGDGSLITSLAAAQLVGDVAAARIASALNSLALGHNQTWQPVTRSSGTDYQNTTGRPIELCVTFIGRAGAIYCGASVGSYVQVSGNTSSISDDTNSRPVHTITIPTGHYYRITGTINNVKELR